MTLHPSLESARAANDGHAFFEAATALGIRPERSFPTTSPDGSGVRLLTGRKNLRGTPQPPMWEASWYTRSTYTPAGTHDGIRDGESWGREYLAGSVWYRPEDVEVQP